MPWAKPIAEVLWPRYGIIQEIARQILNGSAELSFGDGSRRGVTVQLTCFQEILEFGRLFEEPTSLQRCRLFLSRLASFHRLSKSRSGLLAAQGKREMVENHGDLFIVAPTYHSPQDASKSPL